MDTDTTPTTDTVRVSRQRRYTTEEIAETLAVLSENGGNIAATARATGVPEATVRHWRDEDVCLPPASVVEQRKAVRAISWDNVQDMALEQVVARIGEASARDAAVVAGIAVDKAGVLRGEIPHSIIEHRDDERVNRLRQLYATRAPLVVQPHEPPPQVAGAPAIAGEGAEPVSE